MYKNIFILKKYCKNACFNQYCTNLQNFYGGDLSNWKNSLTEDNAVNIGYGENGLVPIWEILPDEYSSLATEMEEQFVLYSQGVDSNINDKYLFDKTFSNSYNEEIRTTEYKITDSGRMNQPYDIVYFKDKLGAFPQTFMQAGKTKIKITLTHDIKEKNDGYQVIFIFYGLGELEGWAAVEYEHTRGDVNKNYGTVSHEFTIDLTFFEYEYFVIRYGARGSGEDTWYTKNLNLKMELI